MKMHSDQKKKELRIMTSNSNEFSLMTGSDHLEPVATMLLERSGSQKSDSPGDASGTEKDLPDFIGSLEIIKQLLLLADDTSRSDPFGLTLHKVGDAIVLDRRVPTIDDLDSRDAMYLLPTDLLEDLSDCEPQLATLARTPAGVRNTFIHIPDEPSTSMSRVNSAPPVGLSSPESARLSLSIPLQVRSTATDLLALETSGDTSLIEKTIKAIVSSSVFSDSAPLSPRTRIKKAVEWSIAGFSVLVGCDIVLMDKDDGSDPPPLREFGSVKLLGKATRMDQKTAWFENSLLQIDTVSWMDPVNHSMVTESTDSLILPFEAESVLDQVRKIFSFLNSACTKPGGSYCIVRDTNRCLLYDVTEVGSQWAMFRPSNNLVVPIAKMSLSEARDGKKSNQHIPQLTRARSILKQYILENPSIDYSDLLREICSTLASFVDQSNPEFALELHLESLTLSEESLDEQTIIQIVVLMIRMQSLAWLMYAQKFLDRVTPDRKLIECKSLQNQLSELLALRLIEWCALVRRDGVIECIPEPFRGLLGLLVPENSVRFPTSIIEACRIVTDELGLQSGDMLASAHAELGVEYLQVGENFLRSISSFSHAFKLACNERLLARILMNMAQILKKSAIAYPPESTTRFIARIRAIACVQLAHRLEKRPAAETNQLIAAELVDIGSGLVRVATNGVVNLKVDGDVANAVIEDFIRLINEKSISSPPKKVIPGTPFSTSQLVWSDNDIRALTKISINVLAVGCFDLSILLSPGADRTLVEIQYATLFAQSDPKRALRHTSKALSGDTEYRCQAICLRSTAQYNMGNMFDAVKGLVGASRHTSHESIVHCLKSIAMDEFQTNKSARIENLKEIIRVVLRGEGVIPDPVRRRR
jgi:hypothetical protein